MGVFVRTHRGARDLFRDGPGVAVRPAARMPEALRILLLGDDPAGADVIERELRRSSVEAFIHHVYSQDAFVPALRDVAPGLILADHRPPRFDAFAAIRACRDLQPAAPVIVLVGIPDQETHAAWLAAGASETIPRDDLLRLGAAVRAALERHETAALAQSERRYRTLVDQNADPIVLTDRTGTIVYASETIQRLLGYAADELVGRPGLDFVHPDDRALARRVLTGGLSWPGEATRAELRCGHKNGTWRSIELVMVNRLDDPTVSAVVSDCREIVRYRLPEAARPDAAVPPDVLSPRQRQVLRLLAEGESTRKIAEQLSLSVKTVETHRAQIMKRLNIRHLAGLVRYAVYLGLTQAP